MAYTNTSYKTLGQSAPSAGGYTTALYSCPANTSAILSTILVTNRASTADTFRIRISVNGAALDVKQWAFYDVPVTGNATVPLHLGITVSGGDIVYAASSAGNLSFQAFGQELS